MNSKLDYEHDYHQRRRRRRQKRAVRRLFVLVSAVVVIMLVALLITNIVQRAGGGPSNPQVQPGADYVPYVPAVKDPTELPEVDNSAWNTPSAVERTIHTDGIQAPNSHMLALPENGQVEMSYFDDAVFVGDSLTQGFPLYKRIPNARYCAYKGISIQQIYNGSIQKNHDGTQEVPMDALASYKPAKVYIQLGANAMVAMDDDIILAYYTEMLDAMKERLGPDVAIYVQSLTPVRPDNSPGFDMDRIKNLNHLLAKLACEEDVYFIDLFEALQGSDGWLRDDFAGGDGYHLHPIAYTSWTEYLATHTAYDPDYPYVEKPAHYRQPDPVA